LNPSGDGPPRGTVWPRLRQPLPTVDRYNRDVIRCEPRAMSQILIGKGDKPVYLLGKYANRHGMIAGATGTGKSVSLMVLAEGFSKLGVPVFLADVKGDLAGLAMAGAMN